MENGRHGKSVESRDSKFARGNLYILTATIFWGVNYAFTKALIPEWMTANGVSAVRLIGGCALFWLTSLFFRREKIDRDDMIRLFLGGFAGLFSCIFLFVASLKYGSAIDISIIQTLPPVWVIVIQVIFMHRRPSWMVYAGVIISFIGAAMVIVTGSHGASSGGSDLLLGDLLSLISSFCFAFYLVIISKPTDKYNPIVVLRWVFLYAAIPALFLLPGMGSEAIWSCREAAPWLEIGFILLCPTFLSYLLTEPAERDIGSVMVSLYQYLTPVIAAVSAVLMGVDKLRWGQAIAMLIIIAGMLVTNKGEKK